MVTKLKAAGAYEVIQHGAAISAADQYMREVVMPKVRFLTDSISSIWMTMTMMAVMMMMMIRG